jgi:hypothetical protein
MSFVVPTKRGRFEVRESRSTPKGPRSQTLASFSELTDAVIEKAREKAVKPPGAEELRRAARRAGAPVARPPIEQAARELIAELAKGRRLDPTLRQILLELLQRGYREDAEPSPANEAARSVAIWMAATPEERGRALVDLLLLADALPSSGRRGKPLRFPRLDSRGRS